MAKRKNTEDSQGGRKITKSYVPSTQSAMEDSTPEGRVIRQYPSPSSSATPAVIVGGVSVSSPPTTKKDDVLDYLNECSVEELVELTRTSTPSARLMVTSGPFSSLIDARKVRGKNRGAVIGGKIVDKVAGIFSGYEGIIPLIIQCEQLGKSLAKEMELWELDIYGVAKPSNQRDSVTPVNGKTGDEDFEATAGVHSYLKTPEMMKYVLEDHQVVGLNWLALMYRRQLGCILADDTGLGKTCQIIALLSHLVETGHKGPHLIICPESKLQHWFQKIREFSPDVAVKQYNGLELDHAEQTNINIIVTSYEVIARKEAKEFLISLKPDACVFHGDKLRESHWRYKSLVWVPAIFKVFLIGTPIQNNHEELAALVAFILPDIFHDYDNKLSYIFKAKAARKDLVPISKEQMARFNSALTHFILRREKVKLFEHFPGKTRREEYCILNTAEQGIQDEIWARIRTHSGTVPNSLWKELRNAAIHPLLVRRHFTNDKIEKMADILRKQEQYHFPITDERPQLIEKMHGASDFLLHQWCLDFPCISSFDIPPLAWMDSVKVHALVELLKQYKRNGDRVLIFSQFVIVLDILQAVLNSTQILFTRFDRATNVDCLQSLIDIFRNDEKITAFLLTTGDGRTGLDLTFTNKFIIFDGTFDPPVEARVHSGQTRGVEVVRLITRGTVEEEIMPALDGRVAGDDVAGDGVDEKLVPNESLEDANGNIDTIIVDQISHEGGQDFTRAGSAGIDVEYDHSHALDLPKIILPESKSTAKPRQGGPNHGRTEGTTSTTAILEDDIETPDVGRIDVCSNAPVIPKENIETPELSIVTLSDKQGDYKSALQNTNDRHGTELEKIFAELGISEYLGVFTLNGFDTWDTVQNITESDFMSMGVKLGHRRKLQRRIADYQGLPLYGSLAPQFLPTANNDRRPQKASVAKGEGAQVASVPKNRTREPPEPDENAPKKPLNPFEIFSKEKFRGMKKDTYKKTLDIRELWRNMSEVDKGPYMQKATTEKDRYNTELSEYKTTGQYNQYQQYLKSFKPARKENKKSQITRSASVVTLTKTPASQSWNSNCAPSEGHEVHGIPPQQPHYQPPGGRNIHSIPPQQPQYPSQSQSGGRNIPGIQPQEPYYQHPGGRNIPGIPPQEPYYCLRQPQLDKGRLYSIPPQQQVQFTNCQREPYSLPPISFLIQ